MELLEAVETIKRECEKYNFCRECPLYDHSVSNNICKLQFDVLRQCPADWDIDIQAKTN